MQSMVEAIPFLVAGMVAFVVTMIVWVILHERKRKQALEAAARRLGLGFEARSSEDLPRRFSGFTVFQQGFDRRALNVLRGRYRGVEVRLFDFQYKTQTSNGKQTQTQTHHVAVALALLDQTLATTTIVPENFGHKLWDALGGDDIDFESDEFSRKFWVKSSDRRAAYDLVHPRMMEFLLSAGWSRWHVRTPGVCCWNRGRLDPRKVDQVLDRLVGFVQLMPSHGARTPITAGARA